MYIGQNLVHGKVLVQIHSFLFLMGLPCWLSGESIYTAGDTGDPGSVPDLGRSPGGGNGNLLHGVSSGQKSLAGCSPLGHRELDTTERLSKHTLFFKNSFSLIFLFFSFFKIILLFLFFFYLFLLVGV